MKLTEIASRDFIVYPTSKKLGEVKSDLISQNHKYIIVVIEGRIVRVVNSFYVLQKLVESEDNSRLTVAEIDSGNTYTVISENGSITELVGLTTEIAVLVNRDNEPTGIINDVQAMVKVLSLAAGETGEDLAELLFRYQKIFECLEEEIFVADSKGYVLQINPEAEKVMGVKAEDVVGRHVSELVEQKIFSPSSTLKVLEQKKKVNLILKMRSGQSRLATSVPVFNDKGEILFVISTTKDVTELVQLRKELEEKKTELEQKTSQLDRLQEEVFAEINFISNSKQMNCIKETIVKIADTDLTVLIQGESGVGKEVVAKTIHHLSDRKNRPFIKINCGLIPENLLNSELFGYEEGAFTGATKKGKIGKIELAKEGTLFLDEIGELPLSLQVKLLEFLQDKEITRLGGTKKIKVNARVVAATNRDLQEMVKEGTFRKDLYYRLNVMPITIPPLRERWEDIPALVQYFLRTFNNKYKMHKKLDPETMDGFLQYDWPGNVRELEHVMERMIVISDSDVLTPEHFHDTIKEKPRHQGKVICTGLMPYKQAKRELEQQLVQKAYEMSRSTYKAAKILQIDQSTVVKILKKYRQ